MSLNCFHKKLIRLFLFLCIPLLFLPKINLIHVAGESAGIRIDDVILLAVCFMVVCGFWGVKRSRWHYLEYVIICFVGMAFLSVLLSQLFVFSKMLGHGGSLLYVFRIFEYFMFFYIGFWACGVLPLSTVINGWFILNAALVVLQKLEWVGGFPLGGYQPVIDGGRAIGITGGPWEVGFLFNCIYCFFASYPEMVGFYSAWKKRGVLGERSFQWLLFGVFFILLAMTGSRIATGALVVLFLLQLTKGQPVLGWLRKRFLALIMALVVVAGVGVFVFTMFSDSSLFERSSGLFSGDNFTLISMVWDNMEISRESQKGAVSLLSVLDSMSYDLSWWMRLHAWTYAFKSWLYHPEAYLTGLGPGYCGTALDGGWLRLLVENGLIGLGIFIVICRVISRIDLSLKWMIIALCINMCFIDMYLAYKAMSFVFFITGFMYAHKKKQESVLVAW